MTNSRNPSSEKLARITETANRFARQMGGTFVEVREKREAYEARERSISLQESRQSS